MTAIDDLLVRARSHFERLDPHGALTAMERGAMLIDIRSESQRGRDGAVPGALFIPRNVLEWRCDPTSVWRDERLDGARRLIVMCDQGYQSSLAAATLCELGVNATDLDGGFQAWRAAGLPVAPLAGQPQPVLLPQLEHV